MNKYISDQSQRFFCIRTMNHLKIFETDKTTNESKISNEERLTRYRGQIVNDFKEVIIDKIS